MELVFEILEHLPFLFFLVIILHLNVRSMLHSAVAQLVEH